MVCLYESEWPTCFQMLVLAFQCGVGLKNIHTRPYLSLSLLVCNHPLFLIHYSTWLFSISLAISSSLKLFPCDFLSSLFSPDVPHFQTTLLSWLNCLVKYLVTMHWVGNTHRISSPEEVCHPSVCGSSGDGGERLVKGKGFCQHIQIFQSCRFARSSRQNIEYRPINVYYFQQALIQVSVLPKIVWQRYIQYPLSFKTWLTLDAPCYHDFFQRSATVVTCCLITSSFIMFNSFYLMELDKKC